MAVIPLKNPKPGEVEDAINQILANRINRTADAVVERARVYARTHHATADALGAKKTHALEEAAANAFRSARKAAPASLSARIEFVSNALARWGSGILHIKPKKAKMLAIPVHKEAYGRKPGSFTDLHAIINRATGKGVLVKRPEAGKYTDTAAIIRRAASKAAGSVNAKPSVLKRGKSASELVMYALTKSANVPKDPDMLPGAAEIKRIFAATNGAPLNGGQAGQG